MNGSEPKAAQGDGLPALAALVLKTGVGLGRLPPAQRSWALALAATVLAPGRAATEAQVNAMLQRCLTEECGFLDTDHVELRRWLIDSGFWRRDGFGRAYERVPPAELPSPVRAAAADLAGIDPGAWVRRQRALRQAERDARRSAWTEVQGAARD